MDANIKINCEAEGFDDVQEQAAELSETLADFPSQVTVKNCKNCTINIYPSQTKYIEIGKGEAK